MGAKLRRQDQEGQWLRASPEGIFTLRKLGIAKAELNVQASDKLHAVQPKFNVAQLQDQLGIEFLEFHCLTRLLLEVPKGASDKPPAQAAQITHGPSWAETCQYVSREGRSLRRSRRFSGMRWCGRASLDLKRPCEDIRPGPSRCPGATTRSSRLQPRCHALEMYPKRSSLQSRVLGFVQARWDRHRHFREEVWPSREPQTSAFGLRKALTRILQVCPPLFELPRFRSVPSMWASRNSMPRTKPPVYRSVQCVPLAATIRHALPKRRPRKG